MTTTSPVNDWFRAAADAEAATDVTVGLRAARIGSGGRDVQLGLLAVGKLVEFRRRELGLTVDQLATTAGTSVAEVTRLERGIGDPTSADVARAVAVALNLPGEPLARLIAPGSQTDASLEAAAARFASRAVGVTALSSEEHSALDEFVQTLVGP